MLPCEDVWIAGVEASRLKFGVESWRSGSASTPKQLVGRSIHLGTVFNFLHWMLVACAGEATHACVYVYRLIEKSSRPSGLGLRYLGFRV